MGNLHSAEGMWYDVAGTDDSQYALAQIQITSLGNVYITYYDSRGVVISNRIGTININDAIISGEILTNDQAKEYFKLSVLSDFPITQWVVVGLSNKSHYRIYGRKPYIRDVERKSLRRLVLTNELSHNILWDPVLSKITWSENTNIIKW